MLKSHMEKRGNPYGAIGASAKNPWGLCATFDML